MPAAHRAHAEWTPSRLIAWGRKAGPHTAAFVERLLESRPHPEQGYRSCLGLMKLLRAYSAERLEAACRRALDIGTLSYGSVKSILATGLDQGRRRRATHALPARPTRPHPRAGVLHQLPKRKGVLTLMLRQPTLDLLHELRLSGMAQAFEEQTAMPDISELSFDDRLSLLLEREKTDREQRRYQRLKGHAKLHLDATIEDLNFKAPRGLDRSLVLRLASGQWIRDGQTVLVSGATGSGKSYLACALGHQACRLGISTRYYRVSRLLDELTLARGDGSYPKLVQRLARTWLLILDDWGLASLSGQGRHDLLEVLDDRYARRGTLLASQIPVEHWHDVVGDPTFGDAILDRLLNNAPRITLKGGSMRRLYDSTKTDSTL